MAVTSTSPRMEERVLLAAARRGDEAAFRRLVEPHHAMLHAHCYRMLGSLQDAEDALQEALLRAWRALAGVEGRSSLRTWLYRIATNTCLTALSRRPKRIVPIDYGGPPTAPAWLEPYPDEALGLEDGYASPEARYEQREAVELAFVAALQHLPPRPRAVLVLRDALGFSAAETAEALDTTVVAVNSALQRARRTVDERLPARSQQATLRALGDRRLRDLVRRFSDAFEAGEVEAILDLLTEDATFAMPPHEGAWHGRDAIGESWLMPGGAPPRLKYLPTRANGQPALGTYLREPETGRYRSIALDVLTLREDRIADVTAFRLPELFPRFGLPMEIHP